MKQQYGALLRAAAQARGHETTPHLHDLVTIGDPLELGQIYVAPPDRHLLVERGRLRLTHGPREDRCRPAVDPLFRSAAHAYATRAIGVVLTGALDDGTAGLLAIKRHGGIAVV